MSNGKNEEKKEFKEEYDIKDTQKIIERFSVQSFAIKGFSLTFLGLISSFLNSSSSYWMLSVAILVICVFWYLDSFYLNMERIYIEIEKRKVKHGLNYKNYKIKFSQLRTAFSLTIWPIYFVQIIFCIITFCV